MGKKQYATGRSRQRAERAKRTQPRVVVTMQKPKAKPKPKPAPKPKPKPKPKPALSNREFYEGRKPKPKPKPNAGRSGTWAGMGRGSAPHSRTIPKNVTKSVPKTTKVPQRKRASVKPLTKPLPAKPAKPAAKSAKPSSGIIEAFVDAVKRRRALTRVRKATKKKK